MLKEGVENQSFDTPAIRPVTRPWSARVFFSLVCFCMVGPGHASEPTPAQKLEAGVQAWVAKRQGLQAADVSMQALDPRLRIQGCQKELMFDDPFSSPETVRVRCSDPSWQLYVRVQTAGLARPMAAVSTLNPSPSVAARQV